MSGLSLLAVSSPVSYLVAFLVPAFDAILPACEAAGTAVLNAGIFNSGLLATERPHAGLPYEYGRAPAAVRLRHAAATACMPPASGSAAH